MSDGIDNEVVLPPPRVNPYVDQSDINARIELTTGDFTLRLGDDESRIKGEIYFDQRSGQRGVTFEAVTSDESRISHEFEGTLSGAIDGAAFTWPIVVSQVIRSPPAPDHVRGHLRGARVSVGSTDEFDELRFSLANFPSVRGAASGQNEWFPGRMVLRSPTGVCYVDPLPGSRELLRQAEAVRGHVLTHVGSFRPFDGRINVNAAESILADLRWWFGFVRGAWSGPLLPVGLVDGSVVWRELADWDVSPAGAPRRSWFPEQHVAIWSSPFSRFRELLADETWREPLLLAISWLVEAQSDGRVSESRLILTCVALEMLAWVQVVEAEKLHWEADFYKISAAGKLRTLLASLGISLELPPALADVQVDAKKEHLDGPGLVAWARHCVVHATSKNRAKLASALSPWQIHLCAQLAIEYAELAVLRMIEYPSHHRSRLSHGISESPLG